METQKLTTEAKDIEQAGFIIARGGLVAFPTETVYGLGANALNADAVSAVYRAKGRPSDNPMIVHIADSSGLEPLIQGGLVSLSNDALKLINSVWPGPLTMVFRKSILVPDVTTGGLDTVAIRMPSNGTARALIKAAGVPIAAPSANLSGRPSPTNAADVLEDMDGRIDAVIMGEQCDVGIESTVVDMTGDEPVILRPGIVSKEFLSDILEKEVVYDKSLLVAPKHIQDPQTRAKSETDPAATGDPSDEGFEASGDISVGIDGEGDADLKPRSPGMKYKHYSPRADVVIIEGSEERFMEVAREMGLDAMREGKRPAIIDYGEDNAKAAHRFFADLRELDRQGYDLILVRSLEQTGEGFGIMNRMLKSAGYEVV